MSVSTHKQLEQQYLLSRGGVAKAQGGISWQGLARLCGETGRLRIGPVHVNS
jgi:hypothetical protein